MFKRFVMVSIWSLRFNDGSISTFFFDAVMFQLHSMINRLEHPQIEQLTNAQLHLILNEFNPISLWS